MALAMLYMYLAAVPAEIGTGMAMGTATGTTSDFVLVPMVFILALLASAIWQLDSIGRFAATPAPRQPVGALTPVGVPRRRPPGGRGPARRPSTAAATPATNRRAQPPGWLSPRLDTGVHIVMSVTMAYMLVLML